MAIFKCRNWIQFSLNWIPFSICPSEWVCLSFWFAPRFFFHRARSETYFSLAGGIGTHTNSWTHHFSITSSRGGSSIWFGIRRSDSLVPEGENLIKNWLLILSIEACEFNYAATSASEKAPREMMSKVALDDKVSVFIWIAFERLKLAPFPLLHLTWEKFVVSDLHFTFFRPHLCKFPF